MRLLIVQYAGDYREAVQRFAVGGGETYYAQRASVDAVAEIGRKIEEAAVLCCMTAEPYNEVVQNGVRAIGAGFNGKLQIEKLIRLMEEQAPTHLVVRTPIKQVFHWTIKHKIPTIATLADSWSTEGLRSKLRNYLLTRLLNNEQIEWVSNHGLNASILLQKIGVNPDKVIPWDFDYTITPSSFSPKVLRTDTAAWKLFFIGSLSEARGVGDLLVAVAKLRTSNFPVKLMIAGPDQENYYFNRARQLSIEDCVEFLGVVSNDKVEPLMREADLVIVPMRHEYPAGFPLVIYHAFCSRTPLIASDHPMFVNNLKHEVNALIFPGGDSLALSESIEKLLSEPELYHSLSVASEQAWNGLQIPVKWDALINRWLFDSPENRQWLFAHRLSSGRYKIPYATQAIASK